MVYAATTFKYVFDYKLDDVYFCTADIGWVRLADRCVCVCLCARAHVRARVCAGARARACVCVCLRLCVLACVCLSARVRAGVDALTALPPLVGASSTAFAVRRCDGGARTRTHNAADRTRAQHHTARDVQRRANVAYRLRGPRQAPRKDNTPIAGDGALVRRVRPAHQLRDRRHLRGRA